MPDFRAKMHQKSISAWGAYSAPPDPLAGCGGPTSKRRGRGGEETGGERREGKGREGKGEDGKGRREERERGGRLLFQTFFRPWLLWKSNRKGTQTY